MKKMYEKPMAFEEAFVADEYVAACYFLACKRGSKGQPLHPSVRNRLAW